MAWPDKFENSKFWWVATLLEILFWLAVTVASIALTWSIIHYLLTTKPCQRDATC